MKKFIHKFNKAFENRIRLSIMALLMIHEEISFNQLKEWLEVSDGNLASHSSALERGAYINIKKEFVGKKPKTSYTITNLGRASFVSHLNSLEKLFTKRGGLGLSGTWA